MSQIFPSLQGRKLRAPTKCISDLLNLSPKIYIFSTFIFQLHILPLINLYLKYYNIPFIFCTMYVSLVKSLNILLLVFLFFFQHFLLLPLFHLGFFSPTLSVCLISFTWQYFFKYFGILDFLFICKKGSHQSGQALYENVPSQASQKGYRARQGHPRHSLKSYSLGPSGNRDVVLLDNLS